MQIQGAIDGMRVVRHYADRPLRADDLRTILNAARRTASSKNRQRWDFVVVRDRDRLGALSESGEFGAHLARAAAGIALVVPAPTVDDAPSVLWDLGRAAQNMTIAAWDRGIGSCPTTVYHPEVCVRELGLPADRWCPFILSFGYPADPAVFTAPARPGGRIPLAEVAHGETWGTPLEF